VAEVGDDGAGGAGVAIAAERLTVDPKAHGELLAPSIAACLDEAGARPADLAAVVAGLGPGPYTGLRVGLVTASALADALAIPSYGVCSLDAIAGYWTLDAGGWTSILDEAGHDRPFLVETDARRHEVYWARYVAGARVEGPRVSRPADVPAGSRAMCGAGARLYAEVLRVPLLDRDYPAPSALVSAAAQRVRAGAPSETLVPLYLRRPDAVPPGAPKTVSQ
jgi:tRNA threonylcarbamoyl adenosine modification protein YeaZ